jgi:hypothetical protein
MRLFTFIYFCCFHWSMQVQKIKPARSLQGSSALKPSDEKRTTQRLTEWQNVYRQWAQAGVAVLVVCNGKFNTQAKAYGYDMACENSTS